MNRENIVVASWLVVAIGPAAAAWMYRDQTLLSEWCIAAAVAAGIVGFVGTSPNHRSAGIALIVGAIPLFAITGTAFILFLNACHGCSSAPLFNSLVVMTMPLLYLAIAVFSFLEGIKLVTRGRNVRTA